MRRQKMVSSFVTIACLHSFSVDFLNISLADWEGVGAEGRVV